MSERRVKEKLYSAVEHNVPDVLDNILAQCDTRKGDCVMTEKKRKNPIFKIATAMAAMLVLVVGIIGASQITGLNDVETVIAFDVNPSIEIEVNSRGQVIDVKALNEDAQIVVGTMKFRNVDLEVAVNAIIGSMLKNGYLSVDQNSILVSVHSRNSEKAAALKETISTDITAILDGSNIEASVIVQEYERNEEVDKIAKENKISHGKAKLIARIIKAGLTDAEGYEYTYERLAALTVNELRVLWNSKDVELDDVQSSGTASETKYLGKEKALELVYVHAAVVVENVVDVEVDMDYEDGIMVYEIEFYSDGYEYEYKLNAITGEILASEKSEEPAEEDDGAQSPNEEVTPEEGQNPDEETTPDEVKPGEQESPDKTPDKEDNKDHPSRIGRGNAKKIAMNHAGFTRDKLRDLECDFDEEDGKYVYKVGFEVDGVEYTYIIDVNSGEILHVETETEEDDDRRPGNNNPVNPQPGEEQNPDEGQKPGEGEKPDEGQQPGQGQKPGQGQQPADKPHIIQKEKVLAIVLKDAKVTMKEVKDLKCELDEEDGVYCYEIEFEVNDTEYEYKVDALTGEILEVNKETEDADEADAV